MGWVWDGDWQLWPEEKVDPDGWQYRTKYSELATWRSTPALTDFVRRRKWGRRRLPENVADRSPRAPQSPAFTTAHTQGVFGALSELLHCQRYHLVNKYSEVALCVMKKAGQLGTQVWRVCTGVGAVRFFITGARGAGGFSRALKNRGAGPGPLFSGHQAIRRRRHRKLFAGSRIENVYNDDADTPGVTGLFLVQV